MTDEALMGQVVAGETAALGVLFERHKQSLFGFLCRLLTDRATAEDVLLDVFLRVYDRRRTYRRGAKFSTWLYTIAHNLAMDQLRAQARREVAASDLLEAQVEEAPQPDELARAELTERVRAAIDMLPPDQRVVILLREFEGMSYREIAGITGASEEAVRVRAHRARAALKQALAMLDRAAP